MDNLIQIIDDLIEEYSNDEFNDNDELEYLKTINFDILSVLKMSFKDIYKMYYIGFVNDEFNVIEGFIKVMEPYFDKVNYDNYKDLCQLMIFLKDISENEGIKSLNLSNRNDKKTLKKDFLSKNIPSDVRKFLTYVFSDNDKNINYGAYDLFITFCNNKKRLKLLIAVINILQIQKQISEVPDFDLIGNKQKRSVLKSHNGCKPIIANLELLSNFRNRQIENKRKKEKTNKRIINTLDETKTKINESKYIDISKVEKIIVHPKLIINSYIYNDMLDNREYNLDKEKNNTLKTNSLTNIERILIEKGINVNPIEIKVDSNILIDKIDFIKNYLPYFLEYSNIVLYIINKMSMNTIKSIKSIISENLLDKDFFIKNVDILLYANKTETFINNYLLFKRNNINIKNISKNNKTIFMMNTQKLENIINIYNSYGIDLTGEYYNYSFLIKDYSKVIDEFIEINEYELIQKNPYLLDDCANSIIKRCLIYKSLNNSLINNIGKLRGSLRKEENFLTSNDKLNDIVSTNYEELMNKDILNILSNSLEIRDKKNIGLHSLDKYLINEYTYKFGEMIVSKNKVLKNLNILYDNELDNVYQINELIYNSILYNYPKIINREEIKYLRNLFNIKIKTIN